MKIIMCWTQLLFLSSIFTAGWCISGITDPPSGSFIAGFEGDENVTTIDCEVFTDSALQMQVTTLWFIRNFRGIPSDQMINEFDDPFPSLFLITGNERNDSVPLDTFRNNLTILRFDATLDGTTVSCGTGGQQIGNFFLRIYREPTLIDNHQVRVIEGTLNTQVDLSESPTAFPFPRMFQWHKNGVIIDANTTEITFGYPTVAFENVSRSDSGNYSLVATNFLLDNPDKEVGNDTGNFVLDVLYGPELTPPNVTSFGTLEGGNITMICGTNLDSNPSPSRLVEWRQEGVMIDTTNDRYLTENGPDSVSLTIFGAALEDAGTWTCRIVVEFMPEGSGSLVTVGGLVREVTLTVVAPPSPPINLTVDSVGATSVVLSWESPNITGTPPFTKTVITATPTDNPDSFDDPLPTNLTTTVGPVFEADVNGLLPNVEYEFTVSAVSIFDSDIRATSTPSEGATTKTHTTVPGIVCMEAPVSQNGIIQVTWDYDHLGGLNVTRVAVNYRIDDGATMSPVVPVEDDLNGLRSLEFSGLIAGFTYIFDVVSTNANGSSTVECPSITHLIGIPQRPVIVSTDTSSPRRLVVSLRTPESGTGVQSTVSFVVQVTELIGEAASTVSRMFSDYDDNEVVEVVIEDLVGGLEYEVVVKAQNQYGESDYSDSVTVSIMEDSPPTSTGSNVGGIAGGIVGAVVVFIIVIIILIVLTILLCRKGRKMELPRYSYGSHEMIDNDLYSKSSPPKQEEVTKDKEMDPNYETVPVTPIKNNQSGSKLYDTLPPAPPKVDNPLYSSTGELRHSMNLESIHVPQPSKSLDDLTEKSKDKTDDKNQTTKQPEGDQTSGVWYATVPTPISIASRSTHASAASLGMSDSDILPPPPPMVHPGSEEHVYTEL